MSAAAEHEDAMVAYDYYLLDQTLSDDERELRDRLRQFGDREVLPIVNDYWERAEFPFEVVPKLAELGIAGTTIQGYGCPGMSRLGAGVVARELARADGSINTFFACTRAWRWARSTCSAQTSRSSGGYLRWRNWRRLAPSA